MSADLSNRVAIVTGASRGIGRAIAEGLAGAGAEVVVVARGRAGVDEVVDGIRRVGGRALGRVLDVSDAASIDTLAKSLTGIPPQILVNAAGIFGPMQLVTDCSPEEWWATIAVNAYAPFLTGRRFAPGMIERGWGRILNITSAASLHQPGPLNSAYATSKVAVNQFTRQFAAELKGTGVTANVFHPGDVRTDMFETIRAQVSAAGHGADGNYGPWIRWMDETGGDPLSKAADLVMRVVTGPDAPNGAFLWIDEPLQAPIPSWDAAPVGAAGPGWLEEKAE